MYATLRDNKLTTTGHDGAQFAVDIDGPGLYEVKTCYERGGEVGFGTGLVEVEKYHLGLHVLRHPPYQLRIFDHYPVIMTVASVECDRTPAPTAGEETTK